MKSLVIEPGHALKEANLQKATKLFDFSSYSAALEVSLVSMAAFSAASCEFDIYRRRDKSKFNSLDSIPLEDSFKKKLGKLRNVDFFIRALHLTVVASSCLFNSFKQNSSVFNAIRDLVTWFRFQQNSFWS